MSPDPNMLAGPPGEDGVGREHTRQESRLVSTLHDGATVRPSGVFGMRDFKLPRGMSDRWPYRMLEERDCSRLPDRVAEMVGDVDETVIDSAVYTPRDSRGEVTGRFRTVTAHARTDGEHVMLALGHADEIGFPVDSLGASVLREYLDRTEAHGIDLSSAPLVGLEPELANPPERATLVEERLPYVLLLDPYVPFKKVLAPLDDDWDVVHEIAAENLFEIYRSEHDSETCDLLPVADLVVGSGESSRIVREFVIKVQVHERPAYFLVWPGLPSKAKDPEHEGRAIEMAERAVQMLLDGPGRRLRTHEFHHRHENSYRKVLWIVQYGRLS